MEMEDNVPMSDISISAIETPVAGDTRNAQTRPSQLSPLASLHLAWENRVAVRSSIVAAVGGGREALLLAQIMYWLEPAKKKGVCQEHRAARQIDGYDWVIKSHADLSRETGLSPDQVKRGLRILRRGRFIEVRRFTSQRRRRPGSRIRVTMETATASPAAIGFTDGLSLAQAGSPKNSGTSGDPRRATRDARVLVYSRTVKMAGNANAALVLARILFWYGNGRDGATRLRTRRRGEWYLVKTYAELAEETGLKSNQVRSAVGRLRRLRLIQTSIHLFGGRRALFIVLDRAEFIAQWQQQDELDVRRCIARARQQ